MDGRRVLVTGASSGIGRATALLLSKLGARLVLVARRTDALNETLELIEGEGHAVEPFDVSDFAAIPLWMRSVSERVGTLDGVVHSAGVQHTAPLRNLSAEKWSETFQVNTSAAFGLCKGFRHKAVCPNGGSIVFLSSVMGLVGEVGQVAYCASKGALSAMAKSLALELARERIRVNCVAPAVVQTDMAQALRSSLTEEQFASIEAMHPLGLGSAQDVAYAIAFLLADTGRWITGTTLTVDGGYTAR